MRHPKLRPLAAAGTLALTATLPLAACGTPSASPRPAQAATSASASGAPATTPGAPSSTTTTTAAPGAARPPTGTPPKPTPTKTRTTRPSTPKPSTTDPCFGAIQYDLDLQNTVLDLVKSMCFHTGGILRMHSIGPGLVTATPTSLVSQSYEAAVVDLRFVRPGTVTVTIPLDDQTHTITVVVRS